MSEVFSLGKGAGVLNEDAVWFSPDFVVVADGVTSKDSVLFRSVPAGRFAVDVLLEAMSSLPVDASAAPAVEYLSACLADATRCEVPEVACLPAVQLGVYSVARRELWRVGNIQACVAGVVLPVHSPPTDEPALAFRAALLEAALADGVAPEVLVAEDPSWEALLPLLSRQHVFVNRPCSDPWSYGAVNGTAVPLCHVHVSAVPPSSEVTLATDGYLAPVGSLAEAEESLAVARAADPLAIGTHRAFRPFGPSGSFDDRAWVKFTTSPFSA